MKNDISYLYKMTKEEEQKLRKEKTRNEIIEMYLPVSKITVLKILKKYRSFRKIDYDDLVSISMISMIILIDSYKPEKCKLTLLYYLYKYLPYKIFDYFSNKNFVYHIKQFYPVSRDKLFADEIDYLEKFDISLLIKRIENDDKLLKTPYQKNLLRLTLKGYKTKEIAKILNRSYKSVSQNRLNIKKKIYKKYGYIYRDLFKTNM